MGSKGAIWLETGFDKGEQTALCGSELSEDATNQPTFLEGAGWVAKCFKIRGGCSCDMFKAGLIKRTSRTTSRPDLR